MRENCQKKLIVIAGPTAVGKTALSVELAGRLGTEIISADSMQVYKGMDIGTAKASVSERKGIPHHMIDICEPGQDFNVYAYQELTGPIIDRMQEKGMIPVMCGGTGLYIQSVIYQLDFMEEGSDANLRKELHELAAKEGNHAVKQILCEVDPESAAVLPDGDLKRIIRAIEYFKVHGEKMSVHKKREAQKLSCPVFDLRFFVLYRKQEELYQRINQRVDQMIRDGLFEEVERLLWLGVSPESTAMQAIGYRQIASCIRGECTIEEATEKIKSDSRHYAKRQLTWFKREKNAVWIDTGKEDPLNEIYRNLW